MTYLDRLTAAAEALALAPFVVTVAVLAAMAIFWIILSEHRP